MGTPQGVRALDEESGTLLWQSTQPGFPLSSHGGTLFVRRLTEDYQFLCVDALEEATGRFLRTLLQWPSLTREIIRDERLLCATSHGGEAVCAVGLDDGAVRWRWPVEDDRGVWGQLGVDSESVYLSLRDGPVVALDLKTGRERWRQSLADLTWKLGLQPQPGQTLGGPTVIGDRVIFDGYGGWITGFSAGGGERLWTHQAGADVSQSVVHDAQYHALTRSGELVTLDPADGRLVATLNLDRKVPRPAVRISRLTMPLLVSDTHTFTGSEEGHVLAFERPKGKYVWSHQPKRAATTAHDGNRFVASGRRRYYTDMSLRLYCLEEDRSAVPVEPPRAPAAARRRKA